MAGYRLGDVVSARIEGAIMIGRVAPRAAWTKPGLIRVRAKVATSGAPDAPLVEEEFDVPAGDVELFPRPFADRAHPEPTLVDVEAGPAEVTS